MSKCPAISPAVMRPLLSMFKISRRAGSERAFIVSLKPIAHRLLFR